MTSSLPIFARQRLSLLTDSGITNLLDSTNLLNQIKPVNLVALPSQGQQQTGHTLQATPKQLEALSSPNNNQALIGRFDDGRRLQFVLTQVPGQGNDAKPLQTVHIYFTYPILGTVRVRSSTNTDGEIRFSFGPSLNGTATVVFPQTNTTNPEASLTFQYTALGQKYSQSNVQVPLHPNLLGTHDVLP